jgi:hypothetical protein
MNTASAGDGQIEVGQPVNNEGGNSNCNYDQPINNDINNINDDTKTGSTTTTTTTTNINSSSNSNCNNPHRNNPNLPSRRERRALMRAKVIMFYGSFHFSIYSFIRLFILMLNYLLLLQAYRPILTVPKYQKERR